MLIHSLECSLLELSPFQLHLNQMTPKQELIAFIEKQSWTFAKTMPHWLHDQVAQAWLRRNPDMTMEEVIELLNMIP